MDRFQEMLVENIIKFANDIKAENGKDMEVYLRCIENAVKYLKEHETAK